MSSAFVREGEHQDLSDIAPTMNALITFLTRENGGVRVYEKQRREQTDGTTHHEMSNGLQYRVSTSSKWEVVT
ncbi:hypothetical protein [Pseudochryseolinea flava]|uniref:Uncharacterized protein n=1 Tax=Pseudochryseolinea flava TaxID=2059302 RepID=A0A364Y602_9BACT|nr:hypothetical protein [Pseudochryseolinea flava]RAW02299.1 hypothetical protein DQQ10_07130 [Pseudochryseolinea flava]